MPKIVSRSIDSRQVETFDLQIIGTSHNFFANGVVVHNCDWEDREPILQYLFDKYQDRCSLIGTELSIKLKTSILDSERAELGEVRKETSWMVKNLSNPPQGVDFNRWLYGYSDANGVHTKGFLEDENDMSAVSLKKWIGENPKIWSTVQKCLGITKTRGIHAGGVLITPEPVQNYCPVMITDKGPVSSLNMKWAEEVGLIKYDFLGVSTLKALGIAIRALRKDGIVDLSWGEFPHSEDVYKNIYHTGKLGGVFQVDTNSMRPFVNKIKPNSIKDISNLVALVRPGALDAPAPDPAQAANGMTAAEYFAEVHNGRLEPYYIHPDLEPILSETYGTCIARGQMVCTDSGMQPIENIKAGDMVLTHRGRFRKVVATRSNGVKGTVRVRTNNGREVRCTPDHLFYTQHGWVKAENLKKWHIIKYFYTTERKNNIGDIRDWLVGLVLADGDLCGNTVNVACHSEQFAQKVKEIADDIFGLNCKVYFATRCWYVSMTYRRADDQFIHEDRANPFKAYLKGLGLLGKNSYDKFMPNPSLMMVAGFFEGDGSIHTNAIRIKNRIIADQIFDVLQSHRIACSRFDDGDVNVVSVTEIAKLPLQIKKIEDCNHSKMPRIFVPSDRLTSKVRVPKRNPDGSSNKYYSAINKKYKDNGVYVRAHTINVRDLSDFCILHDAENDSWSAFNGLYPAEDSEVFDLQVEEDHSFVVEGLSVHNCLFQEQTLQFFRDIVGYTFAEAEGARRAIGKKIQSELEKHYGPAREACQKRGWTEKQIEAIIDTINASARYSFNKAHSAAYAILSYNCAYIKYYWPQYYWLGMLSIVTDDHDYLKHYLTEAAPYVLGVDIMRSHPTEWTIEGNKVRAPLSLIKGCGGASVFKIRDIMRIPLHELRVKKMMGEKFDIEEDDGQSTDVG